MHFRKHQKKKINIVFSVDKLRLENYLQVHVWKDNALAVIFPYNSHQKAIIY